VLKPIPDGGHPVNPLAQSWPIALILLDGCINLLLVDCISLNKVIIFFSNYKYLTDLLIYPYIFHICQYLFQI
jgi:hypothetical protein